MKVSSDFQDFNRCRRNGVPGKENQHRQGTMRFMMDNGGSGKNQGQRTNERKIIQCLKNQAEEFASDAGGSMEAYKGIL